MGSRVLIFSLQEENSKKEKNTVTILALDKLKDLAQDIYL